MWSLPQLYAPAWTLEKSRRHLPNLQHDNGEEITEQANAGISRTEFRAHS